MGETLTLFGAILAIMGVPSAVTGLGIWYLKSIMAKNEAKRKSREEKKEMCEIFIIRGINASIGLGEACAIALRDGKTNGETRDALDRAKKVKHEQNEFLQHLGIRDIIS